MNSNSPTLQVACLQHEIDILNNQMANQAFQARNNGAFGATNNPSVGFQFDSQNNDMNMTNCATQSQMLLNGGVTADNQEFHSQIDITLPTLYGCEEHMYNVPSDIDLPESVSGGMNQEIYVPFLWTGSSCSS